MSTPSISSNDSSAAPPNEKYVNDGDESQRSPSFFRGFFVAEQRKPIKQVELSFGQMIAQGMFMALPIVGMYWLYLRSQRIPPAGTQPAQGTLQQAMMRSMDPLGRRSFRFTGAGVKFSNVIGVPEELAEVKQYVDFLKNPKQFMRLGARMPRGCLLTGQPGTGKTLLAKAVAGEADVPFFTCSGADFIEVYAGSGPRRVREIFEEARQNSPCVIFFDEIDAIGSRGGDNKPGGMSGEENRTINQLLAEMDGLATETSTPIVVFAATNFAENLDAALVREGRFDRKVDIPMPDVEARKDLFAFYLSKVVTGDPTGTLKAAVDSVQQANTDAATKKQQQASGSSNPFGTTAGGATNANPPSTAIVVSADPDPNVSNKRLAERLAGLTPGVSPATISTIVNEGALAAAVDKAKYVEEKYLMAAIDDVLVGKKHRNRMTLPMIRRVALHEAGHALTAWMLPQQRDVIKLSVQPRGRAAGFTQQLAREVMDHTTDMILLTEICVMLGGRTAESLQHTDLTTGAQDDLQRATQSALRQFLAFGMSGSLGLLAHDYNRVSEGRMYQLCSKRQQEQAEHEAKALIAAAGEITATVLRDNRSKLDALTTALCDRRELTREEIAQILGPRPPMSAPQHPLAQQAVERFIHGASTMRRELLRESDEDRIAKGRAQAVLHKETVNAPA